MLALGGAQKCPNKTSLRQKAVPSPFGENCTYTRWQYRFVQIYTNYWKIALSYNKGLKRFQFKRYPTYTRNLNLTTIKLKNLKNSSIPLKKQNKTKPPKTSFSLGYFRANITSLTQLLIFFWSKITCLFNVFSHYLSNKNFNITLVSSLTIKAN